ncbi:hypothetical protein [Lysinibacillus sp. Ag94]|uniref:hypothetical protein n=1 Tax=Lysinibacillus sp. Ag94 TaxID=2936682 RepID=UPI002010868F|nr:hypothetical protein [Lysinibacillus sp. Ag94]UPW84451.1 hypothetical protein MY533_06170 [Lysinibacillus sp. Ag94]
MEKIGKIFTALFAVFIVFSIAGKASASELTQKQKESYYNEYVSIIEETNSKYDKDLKIAPIQEFTQEDWKSPEEFKKIVTDMASQEWVPVPKGNDITPFASSVGTKRVTKYLSGVSVEITVTGSFYTVLSGDRQVFGNIQSITSKADKGTWTQLSYSPKLLDLNRTYSIDIGGNFVYNKVTDSTNIHVEFFCTPTGAIN